MDQNLNSLVVHTYEICYTLDLCDSLLITGSFSFHDFMAYFMCRLYASYYRFIAHTDAAVTVLGFKGYSEAPGFKRLWFILKNVSTLRLASPVG